MWRLREKLRSALSFVTVAGMLIAAVWVLQQGQHQEIAGPARVVDGDTLLMEGLKVRLVGIDAPEGKQTCTRDNKEWACGREAARRLGTLIRGRDVVCDAFGEDKHERPLGQCRVGKTDINAWMVREGWAVAFGDYEGEEREARSAKKGIWSGDFTRPQDWRDLQR